MREAVAGEESVADWKNIQLFVDGRALLEEDLNSLASSDFPESTVVVVMRQ